MDIPKFNVRVRQQKAFNTQESLRKSGAITAGPLGDPVYKLPSVPTVKRPFGEVMGDLARSVFGTKTVKSQWTPKIAPMITPKMQRTVQAQTPQYPTYKPTQKQNIPKTYYTGRNMAIEPELYDAIHNSGASDEEKKYAFALATQESSGGKNTTGDSGGSFGPYHIMPSMRGVQKEQAMDPKFSTQYVLKEMKRNMAKGLPMSKSLLSWNSRSGYKNKGPKYDKDIPEMATTSSFFRK